MLRMAKGYADLILPREFYEPLTFDFLPRNATLRNSRNSTIYQQSGTDFL